VAADAEQHKSGPLCGLSRRWSGNAAPSIVVGAARKASGRAFISIKQHKLKAMQQIN
jgi:hypothetical protein